jgi:hypothetical protein
VTDESTPPDMPTTTRTCPGARLLCASSAATASTSRTTPPPAAELSPLRASAATWRQLIIIVGICPGQREGSRPMPCRRGATLHRCIANQLIKRLKNKNNNKQIFMVLTSANVAIQKSW